ncbi:HU domain-containing protein [Flavobacterium humi]|uniref:SPOR domain-containing protein n=1 Tax=Flavobacterium humi TaxID=2562683 RepID=A0A4Z0LA25_9FLAO|nr:SPOR domain-containing protein [Flavobacterium humi]TGD58691.1 SPOR domain-containing protein [Flavobacterium humi]
MNVAQYISQLLYRYQCVTVPGFGAFLTETVSANIQESNHTFYAPKKEISFNSYLKNNDGLLANHIAVAEKMSYDNVVSSIEKEVASWKTLLQDKETIALKNIGEFRLNSENNLVFVPSNQMNYLTGSFGFSSFVSPAVKREELKKQVEILEEKIPIQFTPEKRISARSVLKYAAVLVMSVGGAGFGYATYVSQQEQSETILVQSEVQKEVDNKIQEATFFIDNPVNPVVMNVKESNTLPFHIVAGAFRNEGNAQQILDKLNAQGFKARILAKNKHGLYPVLYGSFATYTEAQYKMTQIQQTVNQDAWLLIEDL